jgi:hypothetical protein
MGVPAQFVINRQGHIVDMVDGYYKGEVLLDVALAKAGIDVDEVTKAKALEDLKRRERETS